MALAAEPADTPASNKVRVLSGEVTDTSNAAVLPVAQQKVGRVGVAMVSSEVTASFHLDTEMSPMARFSQYITQGVMSCYHIIPLLTSDGVMSKGV